MRFVLNAREINFTNSNLRRNFYFLGYLYNENIIIFEFETLIDWFSNYTV